jgi:glycosyltransferase involved in cell wall biosynthesis
MHDFPVRRKSDAKLIAWWADLQEKHYPEFFSWKQNFGRDIRIKLILKNCDHLVVSSQDVLDDFNRFYKVPEKLNVHIYHFVSVIDNLESIKIEDLRAKYNLPEKYFMVSNQFHKHKNHKVVLQTLKKLKTEGKKVYVAFTGKFPGATDSPYLANLHQLINDNELHDQVIMLGLISRNDQLQLMRHSQAVIQPSLFEGWSTVIEDAKSLQVPVIASNLKVNIEQLGKDGVYFNPDNPEELADILKDYPVRNLEDILYEDYNLRVKKAAKTLLNIFGK